MFLFIVISFKFIKIAMKKPAKIKNVIIKLYSNFMYLSCYTIL